MPTRSNGHSASNGGGVVTITKAGSRNIGARSFKEIGGTGLNTAGGILSGQEFLPGLSGRKAIDVFKEMADNDPTVASTLFAIRMLLRQVQWRVDENEDATDPEGDAQFLDECMNDMSHTWADHISEVLTMIIFGWSWFEIVYKFRRGFQGDGASEGSSKFNDGKVGWRKFAIRSQDSLEKWDFDDTGNVQAMVQRPAPSFQELFVPIAKSLLFRTDTNKNSPEGRSLLRGAYRPWFFKKHIEEQEGIGIERDLAGLPFATVDPSILRPDASDEDKQLLSHITKTVQNVKRNKAEGIVWPAEYDANGHLLYDFKLLSSGGARQFNLDATITRYDQRIAMTMLADFILLGHEKVGSFALSSDKTDIFAVALGSMIDSMAAVYNKYAVPRLFLMNGMDTENLPTIEHGDIEDPDLTEIATYIQALVGSGVPLFPNAELEKHLMEIAHLPSAPNDLQENEDATYNSQNEGPSYGDLSGDEATGNPPQPAKQVQPQGAAGGLGGF